MTDSQRKTANLFDGIIGTDNVILSENGLPMQNNAYALSEYIPVEPNTPYIYHFYHNIAEGSRSTYSICEYDSNKNVIQPLTIQSITENRDYNISFTTQANTAYIRINWKKAPDEDLMLSTGSTPLPYEPYGWLHSIRKLTTATDTLTTLPADVYADGTTATVDLKGNMSQSGTPTPTSPIYPSECGDLVNGDYVLPIKSGSTTMPVYLGQVQSTRKIKKLVLTGEESNIYNYQYNYGSTVTNGFRITAMLNDTYNRAQGICTHYPVKQIASTVTLWLGVNDKTLYFVGIADVLGITSVSDFRTWLAQQYANGTPVTVWYVMATETTGIVNEPIRKIGAYADTVSDITIPTITGQDTFDVETTLKPSEVSLTYTGWHDATVKEWDGSQWD